MRKGDDASCLNLYRPGEPTVLAPARDFSAQAASPSSRLSPRHRRTTRTPGGSCDGETRNGAIPVIADASSLAYVLHRKLGEEMEVGGSRVVFVGALRPGLFQGELLMGERHFRSAFPDEEGYRLFLLDVPPERQAAVTEALESGLSDFGLDVSPTAARLADYHRVENTYISTFQALGALGLVLGTVGLGAVLLRNAFERRRELALLQAVGYRRRHISADGPRREPAAPRPRAGDRDGVPRSSPSCPSCARGRVSCLFSPSPPCSSPCSWSGSPRRGWG